MNHKNILLTLLSVIYCIIIVKAHGEIHSYEECSSCRMPCVASPCNDRLSLIRVYTTTHKAYRITTLLNGIQGYFQTTVTLNDKDPKVYSARINLETWPFSTFCKMLSHTLTIAESKKQNVLSVLYKTYQAFNVHLKPKLFGNYLQHLLIEKLAKVQEDLVDAKKKFSFTLSYLQKSLKEAIRNANVSDNTAKNITTPLGGIFDLGWAHDGTAKFHLAEKNGQFSASNIGRQWMSSNIGLLGGRILKHMCMPGTHDSGMSVFNPHTYFAKPCNTITQTKDIEGQLENGARYFDIRPVISAGQFYTGHYGQIPGSWQGADGQSMCSIIGQINDFTDANQELIILYLSHDFNTDVGFDSYRAFNQDEWNRLLSLMSGISHLYTATDPIKVDLTSLTLNTYIGQGSAAVVVIVDAVCDLGNYAHQGFYKQVNFQVYNDYSDTNDLNQMENDQLKKMIARRPNQDAPYFLLSWTLTQTALEATNCPSSFGIKVDSILDLANEANPALYSDLLKHCTANTYPNILYIDNLDTSEYVDLAMKINRLN